MNKVIVIVGPTSVGKTLLSVSLAKKYNGEIINADSMQIYRGLDIGTAKIREDEKENIVHHLFDIREVNDEYSIYNYQKDCRSCIDDIINRKKTPIIVGGTGLYIKAALYDYDLSIIGNKLYNDMSNKDIYDILKDRFRDINIDINNRRRLVRALNYYEETGKLITDNVTDKLLYDTILFGLTCDREQLYDRINKRVDKMIDNGLINEVKYFYDKNIRSKPLISGIGYKELYKYFDNEITLNDAITEIKKNSRHYAKRQYTFFNHQLNVNWYSVDFDNFNKTVNKICKDIDKLL